MINDILTDFSSPRSMGTSAGSARLLDYSVHLGSSPIPSEGILTLTFFRLSNRSFHLPPANSLSITLLPRSVRAQVVSRRQSLHFSFFARRLGETLRKLLDKLFSLDIMDLLFISAIMWKLSKKNHVVAFSIVKRPT